MTSDDAPAAAESHGDGGVDHSTSNNADRLPDADNAERVKTSQKRKADEAFQDDAISGAADVEEEPPSCEQASSQTHDSGASSERPTETFSIEEDRPADPSVLPEDTEARRDADAVGTVVKGEFSASETHTAVEAPTQEIGGIGGDAIAASGTSLSEAETPAAAPAPKAETPAAASGEDWVAPAPPSVSDWVPPPPPPISGMMAGMPLPPAFPPLPGGAGGLPLPPFPMPVLGDDGLPVPPPIPNLVAPAAGSTSVPSLLGPSVPRTEAENQPAEASSSVPGDEQQTQLAKSAAPNPSTVSQLPKAKAPFPIVNGKKMEWKEYQSAFLKYMKELNGFADWLESPETAKKLSNLPASSSGALSTPMSMPTWPSLAAQTMASSMAQMNMAQMNKGFGKGDQSWGGQQDLLSGKTRVCVYFLNGACRQGLNCFNKHPNEKEADWMRAEFKKKTCKFGSECASPKCLFWHPDKG